MKAYPQDNGSGDDWPTPPAFYKLLAEEFPFDLDVAASESNHRCERWFSIKQNGLSQEWTGMVWCNPPYGRGIGQWIEKAYLASLRGATVVMLLPVRSDTSWWHEFVLGVAEVRLLRGRLGFAGTKPGRAPFPSCVLVYRAEKKDTGLVSYDVRRGDYRRIRWICADE